MDDMAIWEECNKRGIPYFGYNYSPKIIPANNTLTEQEKFFQTLNNVVQGFMIMLGIIGLGYILYFIVLVLLVIFIH